MGFNAALTIHLAADATIAGIVASDPNGTELIMPVGEDGAVMNMVPAGYPYISFQRISQLHARHLGGGSGLAQMRMQINCWALDSETAESLSEAVRERLDNFKGTMGSGDDTVNVRRAMLDDNDDEPESLGDDSEQFKFRSRMDFVFWYAESVTGT